MSQGITMHPNAPLRVPTSLEVIPFSAPPGDLSWVRCLECREELSLHQPDIEAVDRLLGICDACKRWFLIDLVPHKAEALIVFLPEAGSLLDISQAQTRPSSAASSP